jgi:TonB family protein
VFVSLALLLAMPSAAQNSTDVPPQVDGRRIQNVQPEDMWTRVAHCVLPYYPAVALASRITGIVDIGLCVSPKGDVANYRLLAGHPALANSALSAIGQWRFQPVSGPACSRVRTQVFFNADGGTAVELAHAILADDFGDPGLPDFRRNGQMTDSTAVHRPSTAPECDLATSP